MALIKLGHDNITVAAAGTAVALAANPKLVRSLQIQANQTNSNSIYVGDSTVSSSSFGTELTAGNTLTIEAPEMGMGGADDIDISLIYIDSAINGDAISITYLYRDS